MPLSIHFPYLCIKFIRNMMIRYKNILALLIVIVAFAACASKADKKQNTKLSEKEQFINDKLSAMSLDEKIGQLIIIASDANSDGSYSKKIASSINNVKVGGICFFKGTSQAIIDLNKTYSAASKTPLLFCIDGEWGLSMRLTDAVTFPRQLALGASNSEDLVYQMGKNIAQQSSALNIHINFAPSIDININPRNPVIGTRSFGEDKDKVARLGWAYLRGMQENGITGSIKHFPGHGDTETDSHKGLPVINHTKAFIDSVDSYPFRYCIDKGAQIVMVGHLDVPAIGGKDALPASINKDIITNYLKKELGFNGLVITDAMNMGGIGGKYINGEAEVRALIAGVDILLMPKDEAKALSAIKQAIKDGRLTQKDIEDKCRKVLALKYDLGVFENKDKKAQLPDEEILNQAKNINDQLSRKIITLVKNESNTLPIIDRRHKKVALVCLGTNDVTNLESQARRYNNCSIYRVEDNSSTYLLEKKLEGTDYVVAVVCGGANESAKTNYGVSNATINNLKHLQSNHKVILALFANPYTLSSFKDMDNISSILVAYQNMPCLQKALGDALFGKLNPCGSLPVSASKYKLGTSMCYSVESLKLIGCVDAQMNPEYFHRIDSIANRGVKLGAYPGCQIVVMHNNKIAYAKSYGYLTYDSVVPVTNNTIYDIASVSKIMGTTLAMMKLYDQNKYNLNDSLSHFLPYLSGSNKNGVTIKEALSHNARLQPGLAFYKYSMKGGTFDTSIYSTNPTDKENYFLVCRNLYIKKSYRDVMLKEIALSNLLPTYGYTYSDLGFILLGDMVQRISKMPLNAFMEKNFYSPMSLRHISYSPLTHFPIRNIAPTEYDHYFRNIQLKGTVHDPASAMMGGIAGHAGIFANATDIAALCQMLANGGIYKGRRYISEATINTFNTRYFSSRRVLGFDKQVFHPSEATSPCSIYASQESFGHTGFTGTYFWVEPKEKLVFVFLSNRIYPSASNSKLSKYHIRTHIHNLIYESEQNY